MRAGKTYRCLQLQLSADSRPDGLREIKPAMLQVELHSYSLKPRYFAPRRNTASQ